MKWEEEKWLKLKLAETLDQLTKWRDDALRDAHLLTVAHEKEFRLEQRAEVAELEIAKQWKSGTHWRERAEDAELKLAAANALNKKLIHAQELDLAEKAELRVLLAAANARNNNS